MISDLNINIIKIINMLELFNNKKMLYHFIQKNENGGILAKLNIKIIIIRLNFKLLNGQVKFIKVLYKYIKKNKLYIIIV